jgi:hypothetical protein
MKPDEMTQVFDGLKQTVDHAVSNMTLHESFLKQYCPTAIV